MTDEPTEAEVGVRWFVRTAPTKSPPGRGGIGGGSLLCNGFSV